MKADIIINNNSKDINKDFELINQSLYQVIRRNGEIVLFDSQKINNALNKAFIAVEGASAAQSSRVRDLTEQLTKQAVISLTRRKDGGGTLYIEDIQDHVELALMRAGCHDVAKAYVLYREKRAAQREIEKLQAAKEKTIEINNNGEKYNLNINALKDKLNQYLSDLEGVDIDAIIKDTLQNLYNGVSENQLEQALILSAKTFIEKDYQYNYAAARLQLKAIEREVLNTSIKESEQEYFKKYISIGINADLLDKRLEKFNLEKLSQAIKSERNNKFTYLGVQTLYDRYFLHVNNKRIETAQIFFMRVAMGLAINEVDFDNKAIEFYNLLSSFDFMSSTPTLFNSGTKRPQLSSCYVSTIDDDLDNIFSTIHENAMLQKYAGGIGNDWTNVRALGAKIKGTNGQSQGIIPFLKVVNDTAVAVNQGGKRKGAVCVYLEPWHLDIEEFLELRKNTGDDRRRCHDINTACWIPDLFMKRVINNESWTLFTPDECSNLHSLYGAEFEKEYINYENKALAGEIKLFKTISAVSLWRKILSMLYETGHPWITFKDACNIRSPQQHAGVINSSNLCTEITLNTSKDETAVCNLGSVNILQHIKDGKLDYNKLEQTINIAMRMLDNVIDINFYNSEKARNANLKHRPVGLGIMGFADALTSLKIPYASEAGMDFADESMEAICYFAYKASSKLAAERGAYSSYEGSDWSRGILPIDTIDRLYKERGINLEQDINYYEIYNDIYNKKSKLDWEKLREFISVNKMRNSNCTAIAPTATIANIVGVSPSIEPIYQNLYVKSNLSGEFTIINENLSKELKQNNILDEVIISDLKYFDGSVQDINRISNESKEIYKTAFEIPTYWLIKAAARRQKYIDQAQSLNLYMANASGRAIDEVYKLAWKSGLKTTYYLRSLGASSNEKSIVERGNENINNIQACSIDNPDCEACQ